MPEWECLSERISLLGELELNTPRWVAPTAEMYPISVPEPESQGPGAGRAGAPCRLREDLPVSLTSVGGSVVVWTIL